MPDATLTHQAIPPSSNENTGVGGRGHPAAIARTKRDWQGVFGYLLLAAKVPKGQERIRAIPQLEFRSHHRRDADNFYFPIAKPLGDALKAGGWLPDDTFEHYECERVQIHTRVSDLPPLCRGRMTVRIEW